MEKNRFITVYCLCIEIHVLTLVFTTNSHNKLTLRMILSSVNALTILKSVKNQKRQCHQFLVITRHSSWRLPPPCSHCSFLQQGHSGLELYFQRAVVAAWTSASMGSICSFLSAWTAASATWTCATWTCVTAAGVEAVPLDCGMFLLFLALFQACTAD